MSHHRPNRLTLFIATAAIVAATFHAPAAAAPPPASIKINDVSVDEGNSGVTVVTFTVVAKGKGAAGAKVDYATQDNTAEAGSDYQSRSGTLSFSGTRRQEVFVPINGDLANEPNELFSVNLTNSTGADIRDPQGLGTITDDDVPATLSVSDQTVGEGNNGTQTTAGFLVTLSQPSPTTVTVNYSTADGTATSAGFDYVAASGTVTFAPGETSATIDVSVIGDNVAEGVSETFTVSLSSPTGAELADATATGTIVGDESSPVVSAKDITVVEGDSGNTAATFEVTLSHAAGSAVSVDYATAEGTATPTTDYEAIPDTTLDFPAGTTTNSVTVQVVGDVTDEADEVFTLELSNPQGALAGDMQGRGSISDDDTTRVSVSNKTVTEGRETSAGFALSLTKPNSDQVTVDYATTDGSAKASGDYLPKEGSVSFAPGQVTKTVGVTIVDDDVPERRERYSFRVTATSNADLADGAGTGTIRNDDRNQSVTRVSAAKRQGRIKVQGRLTPAHSNKRMYVTLRKYKSGRWVKVRTKRPGLSAPVDVNSDGVLDSRYATRFLNPPNTRRCRIIARFAGDWNHYPSKARKTFRC